ncbi:MAG: hypothetical protein ACHQQQ_11380 [Bacteroidota bacterium]
MKYISMVVWFILCGATLRGGEKGNFHFVGNSSVDLFGQNTLPDKKFMFPDTSYHMQDMASEESGRKSPWIAGLLSLAVPGAGEFYSHSYTKAGIFAAIEAAAWIVHFRYNKMGQDGDTFLKAYVNQHYNVSQYLRWTYRNTGVLTNNTVDPSKYYPGGGTTYDSPPYSNLDWNELNDLERAVGGAAYNGYTEALPFYGVEQYYKVLAKYDQFSTGWDDADTSAITPGNLPLTSRSRGEQSYYDTQRAIKNHYYDIATGYLSVVLVNHIISAFDAAWSATRYNKSLHANLNMNMVPTVTGMEPLMTIHLTYDF